MNKLRVLFIPIFTLTLLVLPSLQATAADPSYGYQLALLNERAQNPQKVLMQKKISPSSASVREFEWILETLRNRCYNSQNEIVSVLVNAWRAVQRRGYDITLLEMSRQISDFSNLAFRGRHNQKMDFNKLVNKLIKDNYPIKN